MSKRRIWLPAALLTVTALSFYPVPLQRTLGEWKESARSVPQALNQGLKYSSSEKRAEIERLAEEYNAFKEEQARKHREWLADLGARNRKLGKSLSYQRRVETVRVQNDRLREREREWDERFSTYSDDDFEDFDDEESSYQVYRLRREVERENARRRWR